MVRNPWRCWRTVWKWFNLYFKKYNYCSYFDATKFAHNQMIYLRIPTLILKFILSIIILGFTSCKKELPKQATLVCPENGCVISSGTNGIDIEVDFAQSQNVPTLTGVLHGVTTETPPEYVNGIRLASARARNNFELLYSYDIKPVLVLSDLVNLNGESPATD